GCLLGSASPSLSSVGVGVGALSGVSSGSVYSCTPTSCWMTVMSASSGISGSGVGVGAAVSGVAAGVGVGVASGAGAGTKEAAHTPRPTLAVSAAAVPPATSLYSGSRAKALPEKYFMGLRLLNMLT